jgi:hydroxymethylpyrimidine/phosphomethylpyrimidine kinase
VPAFAKSPPKALTIAGSDSGGGAGIQADLKTFAAHGVYGASVITAITAQNTCGVSEIHDVPAEFITAQLDAVMNDIGADAAKTGVLSSVAIIEAVAAGMSRHRIERVVVDPVMVATSGDRLLRQDAVESIRSLLLPLALVATPNIPEAEVLTGREIDTEADMAEAARMIGAMGACYVLLKGGHLDGDPVDIVYDGRSIERLAMPRVSTRHTHGTGCTFSAAITARLAAGFPVPAAIAGAKQYVYEALIHAYEVGAGQSPVHHFYRLWRPAEAGVTDEVS